MRGGNPSVTDFTPNEMSDAKCLIAKFSDGFAEFLAGEKRPDLVARLASNRAPMGTERLRWKVWLGADAWADDPAEWNAALSACLNGKAQEAFIDWHGIAGFQGGMENLAPPQRCAAWLFGSRMKDPDCLPPADLRVNWSQAVGALPVSSATTVFHLDHVAHLVRNGQLDAAAMQADRVLTVARGGIPGSGRRARAYLALASAAWLGRDAATALHALRGAAAERVGAPGAPRHADPYPAEVLHVWCRMGRIQCSPTVRREARSAMLSRGSLLPTDADDCADPLAARQAHLAEIWLADEPSDAGRAAQQAAQRRTARMARDCPEAADAAHAAAHVFADGWRAY